MSETGFTDKERLRFRKLLEVAHSTTYSGEREAAMAAAGRLAAAHGMSLHEAAGMAEAPAEPAPRQRARRTQGFRADFGAAAPEERGAWWRQPRPAGAAASDGHHSESDRHAAEKHRHAEALADAIRRGLDAEERAAEERASRRSPIRAGKRGAWRARPEFVRVLLTETAMSVKEIAAAAGVTVYDVFREKLLMRRPAHSGPAQS